MERRSEDEGEELLSTACGRGRRAGKPKIEGLDVCCVVLLFAKELRNVRGGVEVVCWLGRSGKRSDKAARGRVRPAGRLRRTGERVTRRGAITPHCFFESFHV